MAFDDFRIVRDQSPRRQRSATGRQVPFCLFIEPELARVGMNEVDAKRQDVAYRLTELPISAILRTRHDRRNAWQAQGTDRGGYRILGFTALGPRAGEVAAAGPNRDADWAFLPCNRGVGRRTSHLRGGLVSLFSTSSHSVLTCVGEMDLTLDIDLLSHRTAAAISESLRVAHIGSNPNDSWRTP